MTTIFILSFLAVFLASVAVFTSSFISRGRVKKALGQLAAYDQLVVAARPETLGFGDRVLLPLLSRFGEGIKGWVGAHRLDGLRQRLWQAGVRRMTPEQFISIRFALAGAALVFWLLVAAPLLVVSGRSPLLALLIIPLAYVLPGLWLRQRIESRQRQIGMVLSDAIDLLTIAMEAGLAFDSALVKVAKNIGGPLGEEFGRVLWELQIGASRREALKNLAARTTVMELQSFCTTVVQAEGFGVSISKILRTEAAELRTRRRQAAEEAALKTPVKLVFPVILLILPALMVVVLGPGIIRISATLLGLG